MQFHSSIKTTSYISPNYAKWLFRKIDKPKLIEADLDKKARAMVSFCVLWMYTVYRNFFTDVI